MATDGVSWREFVAARPDLAEAGRRLLYQFGGVGLAFLSTVRRDGGPRVHPMCPILVDDGMYALIVPGPKCDDLARDGRYAMHCYPPESNEDAFYLTGRAREVVDAATRERVEAQFRAERAALGIDFDLSAQRLFAFDVERCMVTVTTGHGDPDPQHTIWHAARG
ncbi:MAG: hypothetical protein WEB13_10020 [Dehalococcoidia bacterium]